MDGSPMMFELTHEFEGQTFKTHCGVREFSAPEGKCYVPYWVSGANHSVHTNRVLNPCYVALSDHEKFAN